MNNTVETNQIQSTVTQPIGLFFSNLMSGFSGKKNLELSLAAYLVSYVTSKGHVCLDLSKIAGMNIKDLSEFENPIHFVSEKCPPLIEWKKALLQTGIVGKPSDIKPMILDDSNRLYLYRYWEYQHNLSDMLLKRAAQKTQISDFQKIKLALDNLFPKQNSEINWQKIAALCAVVNQISVISGGPGTGKTTVIAKILSILWKLSDQKLNVALTAPTGKAAGRLQESLRNAIDSHIVDLPETFLEKTSTIHRLLGSISGSPYFSHNQKNPLLLDLVIVDETSMVDLALMSKLIQAMPSHAKLILVGDKDQLASVEPGSVLGDICRVLNYENQFSPYFTSLIRDVAQEPIPEIPQDSQSLQNPHPMQDCIVVLKKNYRVGANKQFVEILNAVNIGNPETALSLIKNEQDSTVRFYPLPKENDLAKALNSIVVDKYKDFLSTDDPIQALNIFNHFRVLCAVRKGKYGVETINRIIEQILYQKKLIEPTGRWYNGQPIMITSNNYNLDLFNGDVGIIFHSSQVGKLRAYFLKPDGKIKEIIPVRLPQHETVFAMTVHKSQGSEFDNVLLILPDIVSPIMTKELIYTGMTRAKTNIDIWGNENIFCESVKRRVERYSGLIKE